MVRSNDGKEERCIGRTRYGFVVVGRDAGHPEQRLHEVESIAMDQVGTILDLIRSGKLTPADYPAEPGICDILDFISDTVH